MASKINSYPSVRSYSDRGFQNKAIGAKLRGLTLEQFLYKADQEEQIEVPQVPSVQEDVNWAAQARERFENVGYAVERFLLSIVVKAPVPQGSLAKKARTLRKVALEAAKQRNQVKVPTKAQIEQAILLACDLDLDSDVEFMSEWLIKAYK